ncbi:hypothetical protein CTS44_22279, partial [Comamonas thiooxydans]
RLGLAQNAPSNSKLISAPFLLAATLTTYPHKKERITF